MSRFLSPGAAVVSTTVRDPARSDAPQPQFRRVPSRMRLVMATPPMAAAVKRPTSGPASRFEWRTAPLWGFRDSGPYLHDGRADTLDQAVALHGGEAATIARSSSGLSPRERGQVEAFLKSLTAPDPASSDGSPTSSSAGRGPPGWSASPIDRGAEPPPAGGSCRRGLPRSPSGCSA